VATATNDIDEIRRRMAQIRRELHEDVQEVVAGAEAVADWRRYVRLYPWATVGAAFAVGFLLAPRRRAKHVPTQVVVVPEPVKAAAREARDNVREIQTPAKKEKKAGFLGMVLGLVGPLALKAAQNYAMSYAEQWIAQQAAAGQNPLALLQGIPGMPDISGMPTPSPRPDASAGMPGPTAPGSRRPEPPRP